MVRKIKTTKTGDGRVETGALQINDDWPGTFIRGDNSFAYATYLRMLLKDPDSLVAKSAVNGLIHTLEECIAGKSNNK